MSGKQQAKRPNPDYELNLGKDFRPLSYIQDPRAPEKIQRQKQMSLVADSRVYALLHNRGLRKGTKKLYVKENGKDEWETYMYRIAWSLLYQEKDDSVQVPAPSQQCIDQNVRSEEPWLSVVQPYVEFKVQENKNQKLKIQKQVREEIITGFENLKEEDQRLIKDAERSLGIRTEDYDSEDEQGDQQQEQEQQQEEQFEDDYHPWYRIQYTTKLRGEKKRIQTNEAILLFEKFLHGDRVPAFWVRISKNGTGTLMSAVQFHSRYLLKSPYKFDVLLKLRILVGGEWMKLIEFLDLLGFVDANKFEKRQWIKHWQELRHLHDKRTKKKYVDATRNEVKVIKKTMEMNQQLKQTSRH